MRDNAIAFADLNGNLTYVNSSFLKLWKFDDAGEVLGKHISLFIQNKEKYAEIEKALFSDGGWTGELVARRKDGSVFDIQVSTSLATCGNCRPVCLITSIIDITGRKRAEEALQLSERRYRAVVEDQTELICRFLPDGTLTFVNEAYCKYFAKKREELIGLSFMPFIPEEDQKRIKEILSSLNRENPVMTYEHRVIAHNGEIRWQQWTDRAIFDEQGNFIEYQSVGRDITSYKQAEEALRMSEERFAKAFNSNPHLMGITTIEDGRYIDVNKAFLRVTGYSLEEVIGHTSLELNLWVNVEDRARILEIIKKNKSIHNEKINFRTKSGEIREGFISYEVIHLNGEEYLLFTLNDITEQKQLESEMVRLDCLHLVGELAASIGHEVRNPMTTVRGLLQLLGAQEEHSRNKKYFDLIIEEIDRANSMISEMLFLAKDRVVELKEQSLNKILETMLPLIRADAVKTGCTVKVELNQIPELFLDEKEIRQVILNLARNGFEAMSSGGQLTIRTFTEDSEVVLSVQDVGKGIAADALEKIGKPFFTTKEKGTGLGLAVCYSIANRYNATIKVETGSGGTTFFIRFKPGFVPL